MLTFDRMDLSNLDESIQADSSALRIRWWVIIVAVLLCSSQAILSRIIVSRARPIHLIIMQVSVIAFAFLAFLTVGLNPLMRLTRLIKPFNRAGYIALISLVFYGGTYNIFGLVDYRTDISFGGNFRNTYCPV